jgi:hypothetical protein
LRACLHVELASDRVLLAPCRYHCRRVGLTFVGSVRVDLGAGLDVGCHSTVPGHPQPRSTHKHSQLVCDVLSQRTRQDFEAFYKYRQKQVKVSSPFVDSRPWVAPHADAEARSKKKTTVKNRRWRRAGAKWRCPPLLAASEWVAQKQVVGQNKAKTGGGQGAGIVAAASPR